MTKSKSLVEARETQILAAYGDIVKGTTMAAACRQHGISVSTFKRWMQQSALAQKVQREAKEQRVRIVAMIQAERENYVRKLLQVAARDEEIVIVEDENGKQTETHRPIYLRDRNSAIITLETLLERMDTELTESGSSDPAENYLNREKKWLTGPSTVLVRLPNGTEVSVKSAEQQSEIKQVTGRIIDNEAPTLNSLQESERDKSNVTN